MKNCPKITAALLLVWAIAAGAVESVPGIRGGAARLRGEQAYLADLKGKPFDFKKGLAVSFWVKGNTWTQLAGIISNLGDTNISKRYESADGSFYFDSRIGGKPAALLWVPKCFPAPLGKWVNVAFSYDTKTRVTTAYCNGRKCGSWDVGKQYPGRRFYQMQGKVYKALPFRIGAGTKGFFDGAIDELFVYDRPLNEQEMAQVCAGKILPGIQAAYYFDDPADPGKDSSPVKRHLTKVPGIATLQVPRIGNKVKSKIITADKNLTVWSRSAIDKTFKYDRVISTGKSSAPAAELAKNEYESFQLVLSPEKALKNVKVTLTGFAFKGHKLATQLHKVNYVKIFKNSSLAVSKPGGVYGEAATMFESIKNQGPGEYPDPIYAAEVLKETSPEQSYAFWVTVKSTAASPAGIYTATALITADGNYKMRVPLKVKVRNFALPEEFSSRNAKMATV